MQRTRQTRWETSRRDTGGGGVHLAVGAGADDAILGGTVC